MKLKDYNFVTDDGKKVIMKRVRQNIIYINAQLIRMGFTRKELKWVR